jgi:hypothetical protein
LNRTASEILTDLDHGQIALKGKNDSIIQVVKGREVKEMMDNYLLVAREMIWMDLESGDI